MEVEINVEDLIAEDIDPDEDIERFRVFVEVAAQRGELERQRLQEGGREQPAREREIVRRMIEGREERRRLERAEVEGEEEQPEGLDELFGRVRRMREERVERRRLEQEDVENGGRINHLFIF